MANDISSVVRGMTPAPARDASHSVELKTAGTPEPATSSANGKSLPQAETSQVDSGPEIQEAVNRINEYVQSVQRDLSFRMDNASGHTVIQVTDRATGELVRQIPSEEVLAIATYLGERAQAAGSGEALQGLLFSQKS